MNGREIVVRVAELRIGTGDDVLVTVGLGSCVAIMLHDPLSRVGGLAHILLPSSALTRRGENPAKVPHSAIPRLLELMRAAGADSRRVTARLAGGASMFVTLSAPGTIQMGERNLLATRQVLRTHSVPLVGEAVGGDYGRTVRLHVRDGRIQVLSVAHGSHTL